MEKAFFYRRFFRRMKRYGLFKAVICDGAGEYSFPAIPEKYLVVKWPCFLLLVFTLAYLLWKPPLIKTGPLQLDRFPPLDEKIDQSGMTGLHRAVIRGKKNIVRIWLRNGANPDAADRYGWTPLHWARFLGMDGMADILIRSGARENRLSTSRWYRFPRGSRPEDVRGPF